MKLFILFSFLFITFNTLVYGQQKPRRFTNKPVSMCPINYSNLSTLGITTATQVTIDIINTARTLGVGEKLPANAVTTDSRNAILITDTIFKYTVLSANGIVFTIIQEIGSFTVIKLWKYKGSKSSQISEYEAFNARTSHAATSAQKTIDGIKSVSAAEVTLLAGGSGISASNEIDPTKDFYLIKTADLNAKTEEFEYKQGSWNIGVMYLPVKIRAFARRSGAFDFTSDVNLGVSFSATLYQSLKSDWTTNLLLYTGVSSIKVDSLVAGDPAYKQTNQATTAFSPAVGLFWEKKSVQLGFAFGMDFLIGKLQKTWDYRGMPWFSLTAGVNIFNLTKNTSSTNGSNK